MFTAIIPFTHVFSHSVVGLNGDVATMTNVQEAGRHLPTNVSAMDEYLPTTELIGTILIIVYDSTNSIISLVRVCMAPTCLKVY